MQRVMAVAVTRDDATVIRYAAVWRPGEQRALFDVAARATLLTLGRAAGVAGRGGAATP